MPLVGFREIRCKPLIKKHILVTQNGLAGLLVCQYTDWAVNYLAVPGRSSRRSPGTVIGGKWRDGIAATSCSCSSSIKHPLKGGPPPDYAEVPQLRMDGPLTLRESMLRMFYILRASWGRTVTPSNSCTLSPRSCVLCSIARPLRSFICVKASFPFM